MKRFLAPTLLMTAFLGCGGGSNPTPAPTPAPSPVSATALTYTDPSLGAYQLRRNPTLSTKTHLVLELWGTAADQGSGVTLGLNADSAKLTWTNVASGDAPGTYVANGSVFDLGAGTPILKARVNGDALVATISEKGFTSPKSLGAPLLRVALDLKAANLPVGSTLTLSADPAKSKVLRADGTTAPITVATGTLQAQ